MSDHESRQRSSEDEGSDALRWEPGAPPPPRTPPADDPWRLLFELTAPRQPAPDDFDLDVRILPGRGGERMEMGADTACGRWTTCQGPQCMAIETEVADCLTYASCNQLTCPATCQATCKATCDTCNTNCGQATCANTCPNTCAATCATCVTQCNQATCAATCVTCNTQCNQATCLTCPTNCNQATCGQATCAPNTMCSPRCG